MDASQGYILISIVVLALIACLVFFMNKGKSTKRLTPLAGLAFALVLAGLMFGENRLLGFGLLAGGIVLAVVDMIIEWK